MSLNGLGAVRLPSRVGAVGQRRAGRSERIAELILIAIASPLLCLVALVIAVMVYVDSPGPVIYRSWRIGRHGERFAMLKFRKMRDQADDRAVTLEDDERFTPIGRFLAATRLDELPQTVNVLRGEMRLVGPRPELECFVSCYAEEYREILTVAPGLTGEAQLRFLGERALLVGPEPESLYAEQLLPAKIQIDLDYVRRRTLWRDAVILMETAMLPISYTRYLIAAQRRWLPAVACGLAMGLVFVVLGSHLA